MSFKEIMQEFNNTHHSAESQWVNNITNEPCGLNPCSVCIRMNQIGIQPMEAS